ncbi:MAG: 3-dehydroquinate synthase [Desulfosalsimonadaceae bacterium]|nr:3-dehydroquinate synthase [Desulfosalsimonadaceae bacterium]
MLKHIEIKGITGNSEIVVGERLKNLRAYLPDTPVVIITDEIVAGLYEKDFPAAPIIKIGVGESIKTLDTVGRIYRELIGLSADRSVFLLGIGGGIVCDVTGFVASTYLRGVRFGYAPTTLLAQVDASVGGKTGVNVDGYKNMAGVFSQPEFVVCDPMVLKTLPERELCSGFAEIVKHAAISDADYFTYLEENTANALALDPEVLERIIYDSVIIKAGVVNRDETEKGERRKLNFGHTFGHAVEKTTGLPHGEAVSIGMAVATRLSVAKGLLPPADADRMIDLLLHFHLPTRIQGDRESILEAMAKDKKRSGDGIHFVLLSAIGQAVVEKISLAELEAVVREFSEE